MPAVCLHSFSRHLGLWEWFSYGKPEFETSQLCNLEEKLYECKITLERNNFLKNRVLARANQFHTVSLGSWRIPTHPTNELGKILLTTAKRILYLIIPFLLLVSCCVMFPCNMQHVSMMWTGISALYHLCWCCGTPELKLWSSHGILTCLIDDLAISVRGHVWFSFGTEQGGRWEINHSPRNSPWL